MVIEEKRYYNKSLGNSVVITEDNIIQLSRIIALNCLKNFKSYCYNYSIRLENLHKQLVQDIYHHQTFDCYSQAYDLVQEASLFLSKHLKEKLGDKCTYIKPTVKEPEILSIRFACFKTLFAYIRKELKNGNTEDDEILDLISTKEQISNIEQDESKVNAIISQLAYNDLELQILQYCYNGVEVNDIAEILNISIWKIYKRRTKFRQRYNTLFQN